MSNILFCPSDDLIEKVPQALMAGNNVALFEPDPFRYLRYEYVFSLKPDSSTAIYENKWTFGRIEEKARRSIVSDDSAIKRVMHYFQWLIANTIGGVWSDMLPAYLHAILDTYLELRKKQIGFMFDGKDESKDSVMKVRYEGQDIVDMVIAKIDGLQLLKKQVDEQMSNSSIIISPNIRVLNVDITNFHLLSQRRAQNTMLPKVNINMGGRSFCGLGLADSLDLQMFSFDEVYGLEQLRDNYVTGEQQVRYSEVVDFVYPFAVKLKEEITDEEWECALDVLRKTCIKS